MGKSGRLFVVLPEWQIPDAKRLYGDTIDYYVQQPLPMPKTLEPEIIVRVPDTSRLRSDP